MTAALVARARGPVLLVAALLVLPIAACAASGRGYSELTVAQVAELLGKPDVRVYDANPREVYDAGHVPGAAFLPYRFDASALPPDREARLVFYCKNPH